MAQRQVAGMWNAKDELPVNTNNIVCQYLFELNTLIF